MLIAYIEKATQYLITIKAQNVPSDLVLTGQ